MNAKVIPKLSVLDTLPVELLHEIARTSLDAYRSMLAIPRFAHTLTPNIIAEYMTHFQVVVSWDIVKCLSSGHTVTYNRKHGDNSLSVFIWPSGGSSITRFYSDDRGWCNYSAIVNNESYMETLKIGLDIEEIWVTPIYNYKIFVNPLITRIKVISNATGQRHTREYKNTIPNYETSSTLTDARNEIFHLAAEFVPVADDTVCRTAAAKHKPLVDHVRNHFTTN